MMGGGEGGAEMTEIEKKALMDGAELVRELWEAQGSPPIEIDDGEADDMALIAAADFVLNSTGPVHVGQTAATLAARHARRPN